MRTNINLNDALIKEASLLTGIKEKKALVEAALIVLIQTKKRKPISLLKGKISFSENYNYKLLRNS